MKNIIRGTLGVLAATAVVCAITTHSNGYVHDRNLLKRELAPIAAKLETIVPTCRSAPGTLEGFHCDGLDRLAVETDDEVFEILQNYSFNNDVEGCDVMVYPGPFGYLGAIKCNIGGSSDRPLYLVD